MGATFRQLTIALLTVAVAVAASDQLLRVGDSGGAAAVAATKKRKAAATDNRSWFLRKLPGAAVVAGYRAIDDSSDLDELEKLFGTEVGDYTSHSLAIDERAADDLRRAQRAAAKALSEFETGYVQVQNRQITLIGSLPRRDLASIQRDLVSELPGRYQVARVSVTEPPYYLHAQRPGSQVELTGFVPDQRSRNLILEAALSVEDDIEVVDRLNILPGAPVGFAEAARTAILQLKQLDAGTVVLVGARFEIVGSAEGINWSESGICNQMLSLMPKGYACGYAFLDTVRRRGGRGHNHRSSRGHHHHWGAE